jgi:Bacterial regulatory proteins, luxR family
MTTLDAAYGHRHGTASRPLVVEESTVRIHVKRILMKLDVRDRVQAVTLAYRPVSTSPLDDDPSLGPQRFACAMARMLDTTSLRCVMCPPAAGASMSWPLGDGSCRGPEARRRRRLPKP